MTAPSQVSISSGACLADQVALLEAERDDLAARVELLSGKLDGIVRKAYRRGYLTGRASQRRGAPQVTNPERHARTWVREALESNDAR